jgi:glucose/arabinose dehydrogenase
MTHTKFNNSTSGCRAMTIAACLGAVLGAAGAANAQFTTTRIASGLSLPLYVTAPQNDFNRAFIVEQRTGSTGRVRLFDLNANTLQATPYLSVTGVATSDEQGLLGLAFHPDFLNNGYFWVYYSVSGANVVRRYQANAPFATSTTANAATSTAVLSIADFASNHNGGWMGFGPDGYLYIASGDGGGGNDPNANGQNINTLLGKMLRIDVDGPDNVPGNADDDGFPADAARLYTIPADNPFAGAGVGGADEIYFMGLRNPWRSSFDRETGDIYIADVGQNAWEEIDFVAAGTPPTPVKNFGWRCMEGNVCTGLTGCTCDPPPPLPGGPLTLPIWVYSHSVGCSISGGYVYRGCAIPSLTGAYFFADYCGSQIWSFNYDRSGNPITAVTNRTAALAPGGGLSITQITSFGQDAFGELYICDRGGEVFKIIPTPSTVVDCNGNGRVDACDIRVDPALDTDNDGAIDACETSACCVAGECQQITEAACAAAGGTWLGMNRSCTEPKICDEPPVMGACCLPDAGGCRDTTEADCATAKGTWHAGVNCKTPDVCMPPPPTGACCLTDGSCSVTNESDCITAKGTWHVGTTCETPDVCTPPPPTGACCLTDGSCRVTNEADCATAKGTWHVGTTCETPDVCMPIPGCACDWNVDLVLNSQDFFDFLTSFFINEGDFNDDDVTNSQDFFDFLACFFEPPAGC